MEVYMKYSYEAHLYNNKLLPFLFHIDRVTSVSATVPNYHTNIELLFCIEGKGNVICGSNNYDFSTGDVVVINTNEMHNVISDDYVRYYCLIVDDEFCLSNGIDISRLHFESHITSKQVCDSYRQVTNAFASREDNKILSIRYNILGLLLLLVNNHSETVSSDYHKNDYVTVKRIKNVVEYIHSNLDSDICLDKIAQHIGISKYHLSRDFKKFTGNTIFEYINIARCKTASALIAGGMSVSLAAAECGFENLSYFSRTFKKYMGTLPSKQH